MDEQMMNEQAACGQAACGQAACAQTRMEQVGHGQVACRQAVCVQAACGQAACGQAACAQTLCEQQPCACSCADWPWATHGTQLDITGCRFSLYPMDSGYARIILEALDKTDISSVWRKSDALSTVYRGKLPYVIDTLYGIFMCAYRDGVHMALEGQLSKGCPGDSDGDSYLSAAGEPPNRAAHEDKHVQVKCKLALYPLGCANYMEYIAEAYRMAERAGLRPTAIHYATRIDGEARQVFGYLYDVCHYMGEESAHYVLHFTVSVNSPTME